jgi:hypothetical protein
MGRTTKKMPIVASIVYGNCTHERQASLAGRLVRLGDSVAGHALVGVPHGDDNVRVAEDHHERGHETDRHARQHHLRYVSWKI